MIELYNTLDSTVYVCFLDISKAFDRVNHTKLFEKLQNRGIPGYLLRIIVYWYENQNFYVKWGKLISNGIKIRNGVRQGGILSPYLFTIYIDDLSQNLNKLNVGCKVGKALINHIMYADDLALISPSVKGLRNLIKICEQIGDMLDLNFNARKSMIMIFSNDKDVYLPKISLDGNILQIVDETKYLGCILSNKFQDNLDIERQKCKIYALCNTINRRFYMCNYETKITLFKAFCTCMYCPQLWYSYKQYVMKSLQLAYHNCLKTFMGVSKYESTSTICSYLNVKTCNGVIRNYIYKFICRLETSQNPLIQNIMTSSIQYTSKIWKHWRKELYTEYM